MSEIWDTNVENKIVVCGETIRFDNSITSDDVKRVARERMIRKFTVKDENKILTPADFPYNGTINIIEYNEAK